MTTVELLFVVLACSYLLCAVDDVIFDLTYWVHALRGRWRRPVLTMEQLDSVPQRKAAIITATWREEEVIGKMALFNSVAIDYARYEMLVGTYSNDAATQAAVDKAAELLPHLVKVVTLHPGPTSKADNLNSILAEIARREAETGELYEFVLMHDPEDVIHPLELKLVNYMFETGDVHMIQLPVLPLPVPARQFTAGTYLDEFAELYTKDMHVREYLSGFVPSAGVATAIRRDVLECLADQLNGRTFAINSLTEDYDVGLVLAVGGYNTTFLSQRVRRLVQPDGGGAPTVVDELVATRAPFPRTYVTSVRQRTRWTIGIVFQAWQTWGWVGSRAIRWVLAHDRKTPWAFGTVAAGYLLVAYTLGYSLARRFLDPTLPALLRENSWVEPLFAVGLAFMVNRLLQRAVATARIYGLMHGALALLRQPWGNFIYVVVAARAALQFYSAKRRGTQVTWDKTSNVVPEYVANRVRLGEHLIVMGALTPQQLMVGLREQERSRRKLGEILVDQRYISRAALDEALRSIEEPVRPAASIARDARPPKAA
jgi:adsorption protein B